VVDGGSTDGSVAIIRRHENRIKHWVSEPDRGHADALNKGFAVTSGEIMGWLNTTDIYYPRTLATVADVFRDVPEVEWIEGIPRYVDCGARPRYVAPAFCDKYDFLAGAETCIQQESVFWRRSLWEKAVSNATHFPRPGATSTSTTSSGYPRRTASSAPRRCAKRGTLERSPRKEDPCPEIGVRYFMESEQDVRGAPRSAETIAVDDLVVAARCSSPFLLKADVRGAELLVLRGATTALRSTEMVVPEVVLPRIYSDESAQFDEVVEFIHDAGFVAWDLIDLGYRPLDGALCQLDIVFVRADGLLRKESGYATPTERSAQIDTLAKRSRSRLRTATSRW